MRSFVPDFLLSLYHWSLAKLAAFWYGFPSEKMVVIGVTGTNGKSSTVNLLGKLLQATGHRVGWTSTMTFGDGKKEWLNDTKMTMLGRFKTQRLLGEMVKNGCEYAVVETSSEGLKQWRHAGINYDAAVFLNLSKEHLEAHGSYEKYRQAKERLFRHVKIIVVNGDDAAASYFLRYPADKKVSVTKNDFSKIQTPLIGPGIQENLRMAIGTAVALGVPQEKLLEAAKHLAPLPGRFELIEEGQPFRVVVDYAHTVEAMKQLYEFVEILRQEKFFSGKIVHLLGGVGGGQAFQFLLAARGQRFIAAPLRLHQRDLPAGITGRRGKSREVARQHRGCWNERPRIRRVLAEGRALIPAEEKEFVPDYRSTDRAAKLIALERAAFRCEVIPRIE